MTVDNLVVQDAIKMFRQNVKKVSNDYQLHSVAEGDTDRYIVTNLAVDCCKLVPDLLQYFVSKYEDKLGLLNTPYKFQNGVSGIRSLLRMRTESYFNKLIVGIFKLQEVSDTIDIEGKHLRSFSRIFSIFEKKHREHIEAIKSGIEIARKYLPTNNNYRAWYENMLVRSYASHKTFSQKSFEEHVKITKDFVISGYEVFIEGPIQLYVKLSDDSLMAIINLFSQNSNLKPFKPTENERMLSDMIHSVVRDEFKSGLLDKILIILKESLCKVCDDRAEEERTYRRVIGRKTRDKFINEYENGDYFKTK